MSGWLADWRNSWLFDWLIFWSVDWLILWFPRCLTDCKVLWMNDWLINWMIDWFSDWLTYWLADWVIDWLIDDWTSMDQARIGQQTNLQMDQNWLIEWLSDWLIDWLIDLQASWEVSSNNSFEVYPSSHDFVTNLLLFPFQENLLWRQPHYFWYKSYRSFP